MADNLNKRLVQRPCRPLQSSLQFTSTSERDRQDKRTSWNAAPRHDHRHQDLLSDQQQRRAQNAKECQKNKGVPDLPKANLLSKRCHASAEQEQYFSITHSRPSDLKLNTDHHPRSLSERIPAFLDSLNSRLHIAEPEGLPKQDPDVPDSNISDLWSEVMRARAEIPMDGPFSYDLSQEDDHVLPALEGSVEKPMGGTFNYASTQGVQNPLVSMSIPYSIPDGTPIENICEHLKDNNNSLKSSVLGHHDASMHSKLLAQIHNDGERLVKHQLTLCFFLNPYIETSATGITPPKLSPLPEIDSLEVNPWRDPTQSPKQDHSIMPDVSQIVLKYRDTNEKNCSFEFGMVIKASFRDHFPRRHLMQVKLPSWDFSNNICATFLSVLCAEDIAELLDPWVDAACEKLSGVLKIQRHPDVGTKEFFAENLRQYGYLSSGATLTVWEMRCKLQQSEDNRPKSNSSSLTQPYFSTANPIPSKADSQPKKTVQPTGLPYPRRQLQKQPSKKISNTNSVLQPLRLPARRGRQQDLPSRNVKNANNASISHAGNLNLRREAPSSLAAPDPSTILQPQFEIRLVSELNLAKKEDVIRFSQYHRTILEWGLGKYCLPYAQNLIKIEWLDEEPSAETMTCEEAQEYWKDTIEYKRMEA